MTLTWCELKKVRNGYEKYIFLLIKSNNRQRSSSMQRLRFQCSIFWDIHCPTFVLRCHIDSCEAQILVLHTGRTFFDSFYWTRMMMNLIWQQVRSVGNDWGLDKSQIRIATIIQKLRFRKLVLGVDSLMRND